MKYKVNIKEIHYLEVEIEADSPQSAKQKVSDAYSGIDSEIIDFDELAYSHTLPVEDWTVSENHDNP
jgi:hypothetical protein